MIAAKRTGETAGLLTLLLAFGACGGMDGAQFSGKQVLESRLGSGTSSASAEPPVGKLGFRPSIVLITVDTLRREHLGCYGYFRETSPRIDALAAESVLFEGALATMASTLPSHLSMFTGLYPYQHGKTSNVEAVRAPFRSSEGCVPLAAALSGAGWRTAGFVSSVVLHENTGIGEGFQVFEHPLLRYGPFEAPETTSRALRWLEEDGEEATPFFLWIHYWDVHEPNVPAPGYTGMFERDAELSAWMEQRGLDADDLARRFAADATVVEHFFGSERPGAPPSALDVAPRPAIDRAALEDLWNRYDACVREVDDQIGRVIDALKASGAWDRSIVVLTADHGQSLGEDHSFGHGRFTNVNTFVPLIVHFPADVGGRARREGGIVSLVDLAPTLLARFDEPALHAFGEQLEGRDLLSPAFDRPFAYTQEATRFTRREGLECALVSRRWKYVHRDHGAEELYDLEGAGEFTDVLAANSDVAAKFERELAAMLERVPLLAESIQLEPEETSALLEDLEDLGYTAHEE